MWSENWEWVRIIYAAQDGWDGWTAPSPREDSATSWYRSRGGSSWMVHGGRSPLMPRDGVKATPSTAPWEGTRAANHPMLSGTWRDQKGRNYSVRSSPPPCSCSTPSLVKLIIRWGAIVLGRAGTRRENTGLIWPESLFVCLPGCRLNWNPG